MNVYAEAQKWIGQGVAVIPVGYRAKQPDDAALRYVGSVDATGRASWERWKHTLPTENELRPWFGSRYPRNLGVITGWQGLCILDFDDMNAYTTWAAWACEDPGSEAYTAAQSYSVATSRGVHCYVWTLDAVSTKRAHLDVLQGGAYALGAGSVHPSGAIYQALDASAAIAYIPSIAAILPPTAILPGATTSPPHTRQLLPPAPIPATRRAIADDPLTVAGQGRGRLFADAKQAARLEDFLGDLTPSGRGYHVARCPLHDDHAPSLSVRLDWGRCKCLAGCMGGAWFDVVDLAAALWHTSQVEAAQLLIQGRG